MKTKHLMTGRYTMEEKLGGGCGPFKAALPGWERNTHNAPVKSEAVGSEIL